jgi:hypothetical protein
MAGEATKSVNYRKPPTEYQFKKGQSGNPKGRPKKKRSSPSSAAGGGIHDRIAAMALLEATRPIIVREGSRAEAVPSIQAVLRSMFRSAAQGDSKSQRQLLELITRAEADRATAATDYVKFMIDYQASAQEKMADHERRGLEPPELYPHPDDIIFDMVTGEVRIDGPLTKEEAGAQKVVKDYAIKKILRFFELDEEVKKDPGNKALRKEWAEHKQYLDYMEKQGERNIRLTALKQWRDALKPQPVKQKKKQLSAVGRKSEESNNS